MRNWGFRHLLSSPGLCRGWVWHLGRPAGGIRLPQLHRASPSAALDKKFEHPKELAGFVNTNIGPSG